MWKLLATVMTISDTGSVSVSSVATDFMSERDCVMVVQNYYTVPPPQEVNGHLIVTKVNAVCVPQRIGGVPPPIGSMINGFIGGFR